MVDVDLRLLQGLLTAEDLKRLLMLLLCFVNDFQRGADYIYRENTARITNALWISYDGYSSVCLMGTPVRGRYLRNKEGVSSDIGIVREFKDQIARTYKILGPVCEK